MRIHVCLIFHISYSNGIMPTPADKTFRNLTTVSTAKYVNRMENIVSTMNSSVDTITDTS